MPWWRGSRAGSRGYGNRLRLCGSLVRTLRSRSWFNTVVGSTPIRSPIRAAGDCGCCDCGCVGGVGGVGGVQRAGACGGSGALGLAECLDLSVRQRLTVAVTFSIAGCCIDGGAPDLDVVCPARRRAPGGQFAAAGLGDIASASESGVFGWLRDRGAAEPELECAAAVRAVHRAIAVPVHSDLVRCASMRAWVAAGRLRFQRWAWSVGVRFRPPPLRGCLRGDLVTVAQDSGNDLVGVGKGSGRGREDAAQTYS